MGMMMLRTAKSKAENGAARSPFQVRAQRNEKGVGNLFCARAQQNERNESAQQQAVKRCAWTFCISCVMAKTFHPTTITRFIALRNWARNELRDPSS
jgi:hypothetical protein